LCSATRVTIAHSPVPRQHHFWKFVRKFAGPLPEDLTQRARRKTEDRRQKTRKRKRMTGLAGSTGKEVDRITGLAGWSGKGLAQRRRERRGSRKKREVRRGPSKSRAVLEAGLRLFSIRPPSLRLTGLPRGLVLPPVELRRFDASQLCVRSSSSDPVLPVLPVIRSCPLRVPLLLCESHWKNRLTQRRQAAKKASEPRWPSVLLRPWRPLACFASPFRKPRTKITEQETG
jgi:hypothetical protein